MLTFERVNELLRYEDGQLYWRVTRARKAKAGMVAGTINPYGYRVLKIDGQMCQVSRVIWLLVTGTWPIDEIDHRDRIPTNNKFHNLRPATSTQNKWNARKKTHNTSGYKGVYWNKAEGKWACQIRDGKTRLWLGLYDDLHQAAFRYDQAALELHGEFAKTNFPSRRDLDLRSCVAGPPVSCTVPYSVAP